MPDKAQHTIMDDTIEQAPALPMKSGLRSSRFLDVIDTKSALDGDQPPLSPATAPHDVYLSSEEDASSSADDFSDYDFESDSEESAQSPGSQRRSHEDVARLVSIVFQGKPSVVQLPSRKSADAFEPHGMMRSGTEPLLSGRRTSISSTASTSILSTFSRSSTLTSSSQSRQKPSFLSTDPYAENARPSTPKAAASSMLKRTFSLARKRSKPMLRQPTATGSPESIPRSASVEPSTQYPSPRRRLRHTDAMTVARNSIAGSVPEEEAAKPTPKGHSRLRSGLSISISRRMG